MTSLVFIRSWSSSALGEDNLEVWRDFEVTAGAAVMYVEAA